MSRGRAFCARAIRLADRHAEDLARAGQREALAALQGLAGRARAALAEGGSAPDEFLHSELQRLVPAQSIVREELHG